MTEPKKHRRNGRYLQQPQRSYLPGLISRVLPLIVLIMGALWLMSTMQSASAQFPQRFPAQQQQPAPQFIPQRTAIPSAARIPTAAQQQPTATSTIAAPVAEGEVAAGAEGQAFYSDWQIPGFVSKIMEGGWLMLPLALCSLIVVALSMERLLALRRGRVIPRPFVRRFTESVEDGQLSYEEATEICTDFDCPVSEVFRAAVRRWGRPMLEIEQAVMDAGDRVADRLRRFLRVFHAISNVAPLIGLLGTVIGMIQAFEVISTQESLGRPEMLASGISTALMTTAGGLCVAIPAYLAYMYFSSKSDRLLNEIDKLCQRVIDSISAEGLDAAGSSSRSRKRRAA